MASASKAKILIADDNPPGAELLEAYLSDQPYETRTAFNGDEALEIASTWHPDLILLDVMMPRISGFEVCQKLRENPATRNTGVIMVTALDQPGDIDRAVHAGTDDLLTKPVSKADLIVRLTTLLDVVRQNPASGMDRAVFYIQSVERGGV
ncbi:MAG: response regulator [Gemmataceae bacterium]